MAQSIGQAHQFARSGAADWVLTSRSMTITDTDGTFLPIEPSLHDPIIQQMIIISDTQPVRDFWQWVQDSPTARAIIANNGPYRKLPKSWAFSSSLRKIGRRCG